MSFPDIADSFQPRLPPMGPFIPGGGGAAGALSSAKFVDPDTTVPHADQNGSDEAPYATITDAVEALVLVGGGAVLLVPRQYPAETITPSVAVPLTLRGLSFGDAPPCDLTNINLNNKAAVALIDLFAFGDCTYRDSLYVENCNIHDAVFDGEAPSGNAQLLNTTANVVETDFGRATKCTIQLFFNTGSCILERTDVVVQLTCGGNLIMNGLVGQNSIPNATSVDITVTANGYALNELSCFRLQQIEACEFSGLTTVISAELRQPIRNCTFIAGAELNGPAGASFLMDAFSFASFNAAGGTVSGGATIEVWADLPTARVSIVVPALATDEMGFATASLVGTILEGIQPNTPIVVTTTQDLSAAGAGRGGVLGSPRISAANTVKVSFAGALAGGASDILVTKLGAPTGP